MVRFCWSHGIAYRRRVNGYLEMVKPFATGPQETILNFAWIIGDEDQVTRQVQQDLDLLLSPYQERQPLTSNTVRNRYASIPIEDQLRTKPTKTSL